MKMCREPGLSCLETSLAHPDMHTAVLFLLFMLRPKLMILLSLGPGSQPYWTVSCEHGVAVWCSLSIHYRLLCAIISLLFVPTMEMAACLLVVLHTEGKQCSGFIALHADCLTSRTTAPAFFLLSLCQCEGCYGCSAARNLFLVIYDQLKTSIYLHKRHTHTHPNLKMICVHIQITLKEHCFTHLFSN